MRETNGNTNDWNDNTRVPTYGPYVSAHTTRAAEFIEESKRMQVANAKMFKEFERKEEALAAMRKARKAEKADATDILCLRQAALDAINEKNKAWALARERRRLLEAEVAKTRRLTAVVETYRTFYRTALMNVPQADMVNDYITLREAQIERTA